MWGAGGSVCWGSVLLAVYRLAPLPPPEPPGLPRGEKWADSDGSLSAPVGLGVCVLETSGPCRMGQLLSPVPLRLPETDELTTMCHILPLGHSVLDRSLLRPMAGVFGRIQCVFQRLTSGPRPTVATGPRPVCGGVSTGFFFVCVLIRRLSLPPRRPLPSGPWRGTRRQYGCGIVWCSRGSSE